MNITRVYEDAKDVHVSNYILYAKASDDYVYKDSELKNKVNAAELKELFNKGIIIIEGGVSYIPVSYKDNGSDKGSSINYLKASSNTVILVTVNSEEYSK